ncbi:MAG: type II toxin-antitoxin system VapB family antitoxin [Gemmatimonadota bacterium]
MALNIKNEEVERLAREVAEVTGETKTEAIRRALRERRDRVGIRDGETRAARLVRFLEGELWPTIPDDELGRRLTRDEEEEILGYGPEGV